MPKGENSDAPEQIWVEAPELIEATHLSSALYVALQDDGDGVPMTPYLRLTPARAAADQMLEALKVSRSFININEYPIPSFERRKAADAVDAAIAAAEGEKG